MATTHETGLRTNKRWSTLLLAGAAAIAGLAAAPGSALADRGRDDRDFGRFRDGRAEFRYDDRHETRRVWVAQPEYRTVCEKVWVEPVYRIETNRVWCPPVTQTVYEK